MVLPIVDFRVPIVNSAGEVVMLDDFYKVGHRQLGSLMTLGLRALERGQRALRRNGNAGTEVWLLVRSDLLWT
jgi:hypothetical protein